VYAAAQSFTVNTPHSLLCVYRDQVGSGDWNYSASRCFSGFGGGSLCTYEQIRRTCFAIPGFAPVVNQWLGDRIGDDDGIYTNMPVCNNFDENANVGDGKPGRYCCHEWKKY